MAGRAPPPTTVHYPSHLDLLAAIAAGVKLGTNQIDDRLKAASEEMGWQSTAARTRSLTHFMAYRSNDYDAYKAAAIARSDGSATSHMLELANGLSAEIQQSTIMVPAGQIVFHGRSDDLMSSSQNYPAFVSTTINPFVARESANRRNYSQGGHAQVYALTLAKALPALWGHFDGSFEWELLLDAELPVSITNRSPGKVFEIVQATIG